MSNLVRQHRQAKGWSQLRLAAETGITPSDISQLEQGKKPAFPAWRKKISEALEEKEEVLFPDREEANVESV